MAIQKVLVEPKDKTPVGWFVQFYSWNEDRTRIIAHRLKPISGPAGEFRYETADLTVGTYYLRLVLTGADREVSAKVESAPPIAFPIGAKWPLTVKVPAQRTQYSDTYEFKLGLQ